MTTVTNVNGSKWVSKSFFSPPTTKPDHPKTLLLSSKYCASANVNQWTNDVSRIYIHNYNAKSKAMTLVLKNIGTHDSHGIYISMNIEFVKKVIYLNKLPNKISSFPMVKY